MFPALTPLISCVALVSAPDRTVLLRCRFHKGSVVHELSISSFSLKMTFDGHTRSTSDESKEWRKGVTLSVAPDGTATLQSDLERAEITRDGHTTNTPSPTMVKRRLTTISPLGKIQTLGGAKNSDFGDALTFPERPVSPGDHWSGSSSYHGHSITITKTLVSVDSVRGSKIALIRLASHFSPALFFGDKMPKGVVFSGGIGFEGTLRFDVARGRVSGPVHFSMSGDLTINNQGHTGHVSLKGVFEASQIREP